jgi:hypothetical protein
MKLDSTKYVNGKETSLIRFEVVAHLEPEGIPAALVTGASLAVAALLDVILNILARRREPAVSITIVTTDRLKLGHAPTADCARCDRLRRAV